MRCLVSHEIATEKGFAEFKQGEDYPATEIGDRGHYFAEEAPKPANKTKEVKENDAAL